MTDRPLILITNDDGIYAPGIKHLYQALINRADLIVVAPATEQSAVSLSITVRHPLKIEQLEWPLLNTKVWSINGTPADCVKLALHTLLPRAPQLIVSGINRGSNAGRNVLYSGTVAAIIEGIMHQVPGIAFSASDYANPSYQIMEPYIELIVSYALNHPLATGTFLNVNFPSFTSQELKGINFARQGKGYLAENPEQRQHPTDGNIYYWLGAKQMKFEEESNSDIQLLQQGYITVVPLKIDDLTDYHYLQQQEEFNHFIAEITQKK